MIMQNLQVSIKLDESSYVKNDLADLPCLVLDGGDT